MRECSGGVNSRLPHESVLPVAKIKPQVSKGPEGGFITCRCYDPRMRRITAIAFAVCVTTGSPMNAQASRDQATYGSRLTTVDGNVSASASMKANRRLDTRLNLRINNRIDRFNSATSSVSAAIAASQAQLAKQPAPVEFSPADDPQ